LHGTLPDQLELTVALNAMANYASEYGGYTVLVLLARIEDEPDSALEDYEQQNAERREKFLAAIDHFEEAGEDYFQTELRRLSEQWHAQGAIPDR
jgi:hypothetical protein